MDDLSTRVVLFTISGSLAKRQCESELHQTKQKTFYLVEIKASELADFPGVNTPYMKTELFFFTI